MKTFKLKTGLFFIICLLSIKSLYAQPGCPSIDAGNNQTITCSSNCTDLTATVLATGATTTYTCTSIPYAPPYPYNGGTPILVHIDDRWSAPITLPFNFCFYGHSFNQIIAGSNGVISFDTTGSLNGQGYCAWSYYSPVISIPSTQFNFGAVHHFFNTIFGPYYDIDPAVTGSGNMYYAILGQYPCRTLVVSWDHIPMFSCNAKIGTQMTVLYESTNVIETYILAKPNCATWNGNLACIGIQNSDGTVGCTPPGRNSGVWTVTTPEAWRFTPSGTPNYTISWWQGGSQIGTGPTIHVCPTSTTTYQAQVDYDVCSGNDVIVTDSVTVNYNGSFSFSATPAHDTICSNQSVQLNASTASSYSWSPTSGLSCTTCPNPVATPTSSTVYSVTGIDNSSGCTTTAIVAIIVNTNSAPIAGSNSPICRLDTLKLTSNSSLGYSWTGPGGFSSTLQNPMIINATPSATGTYSLTVTGAGGCTSSTTVAVTVNPNPVITPTATPASICTGASSSLSATSTIPGTTYSWMPGSLTGSPVTVSPNSNTTYTVTGTASGCTGSATVSVSIYPVPTVTVPSNITVCNNGTVGATNFISSPTGGTFTWTNSNTSIGLAASGSGNIPAFTATNTTTGNITATITITPTANGCQGTPSSYTITVNSSPTVTVPTNIIVCNTGTIAATNFVSNPAGGTFNWTNSNTAIGIAANGSGNIAGFTATNTTTAPITATISVTPTVNTCVGVPSTYTITVNPTPTVTVPANIVVCNGVVVTPTNFSGPVAGTTYAWTNSNTASGLAASGTGNVPGFTATNTTTGPITATITVTPTANNCVGTPSTYTVTVNVIPTSTFTATSPICSLANSVVNYTGNGLSTATYNWNFNGGNATAISGLQNYNVQWSASGEYYVTLTVVQNGCTSTTTSHKVIISNLKLNASTTANVTCHGLSDGTATVIPSNAISPYTYHWNTTPVQNTQNAGNLAAGTYIVTVTDSVNCTATDTVTITQPTILVANMSAIHNVSCFNGNNGSASVATSGGTPGYTYNWSGGTGSGNTVTGLSHGTYSVTVSDSHSCDTIISFTINQPAVLALNLSGIDETCVNSCNGSITATVTGGTTPYVYHWSNVGSITNVLSNLCAGIYSVTITDSNNCNVNDQMTIITTNILNAAGYANPTNTAIDQNVNFYYTGSTTSSYSWNFGDGTSSTLQNPVHVYTTDGTYTVTLTISSGEPDNCEDVTTLTITIYVPSTIEIPNIFTPNGDGVNDEFKVKSTGLGSEEMVIYNRWGKKIFSWDKVGGSWDGNDGNSKAADGTYFYIYTAKGAGDGKTFNVNGTVTLLR